MRQKKYSESKIKTAQKFLSNYDLSFDTLDESQKKIVINYTYTKKYFLLGLILFVFSLVVFSVGAYITYQAANSGIDEISKMSVLENEDALHVYGKFCFKWGFNCGLYSCVAFLMVIYIILISVVLRAKFQMLNAFLPALKHLPGNVNGLKDQDSLAQGNALGTKNTP